MHKYLWAAGICLFLFIHSTEARANHVEISIEQAIIEASEQDLRESFVIEAERFEKIAAEGHGNLNPATLQSLTRAAAHLRLEAERPDLKARLLKIAGGLGKAAGTVLRGVGYGARAVSHLVFAPVTYPVAFLQGLFGGDTSDGGIIAGTVTGVIVFGGLWGLLFLSNPYLLFVALPAIAISAASYALLCDSEDDEERLAGAGVQKYCSTVDAIDEAHRDSIESTYMAGVSVNLRIREIIGRIRRDTRGRTGSPKLTRLILN